MLLNYMPSKIWMVMVCYMVYCISDGLVAIQISEGDIANQYIGCYYVEGNRSNWTVGFSQNNDLSISRCLETCRNLNRTYAILQRGEDCLCGDSFNSSISNDRCNAPCSGNSSEYCGGSKMGLQYSIFYAVCPIGRYLADCSGVCHCKNQIPCNLMTGACPNGCDGNWTNRNCNEESTFIGRYIGCYKDGNPRALPIWNENTRFVDSNPIRYCSRFCAENNATYAGLQAAAYCLCGENYDRYGKVRETSCNWHCSGNSSQICGGDWRNSVYSVCAAGRFGTECLDICNCRDGEVCNFLNGSCKSGCKPGWTGDSCSLRDCSSNNGDCPENETCLTVNLSYASVSRCACSSGYGRDTLWDKCRDLDECSLSLTVCDKEAKICHNTIGGFNCTCNSGFVHNGKRQENPALCFSFGTIIGVAVGSVAGTTIIFLITGLVIIYRRKQRTGEQQTQSDAERRHDDYTDQMALEVYESVNRGGPDYEAVYTPLNQSINNRL